MAITLNNALNYWAIGLLGWANRQTYGVWHNIAAIVWCFSDLFYARVTVYSV